MLHPEIACDTVAERGKARLARAATIAQARAARRARCGRCGRSVSGLLSGAWLSLRPRAGLTSVPEAAHAGGVRVDHRATLMAALFKGVNTGSGES
jgi:hypothetical protein